MKRYVTEYMGHKVPDGAEYYNNENCFFYNKDRVLCFDTRAHSKSWAKTVFLSMANEALELPEAKWEPVTGEVCECTDDMKVFEVCIPRFLGNETCIIDLPRLEAFESYFPIKALKFRPLKTAKELEREALHLAVIDACMPIHSDDFNIDEIVGALFHAGFTAPKESKC